VSEDLQTIDLASQGGELFAADLPELAENGEYKIVVHAKDGEGLHARPLRLVIEVVDGLPKPTVTPEPELIVTPTATPEPKRRVFIPVVSK